MPSSPKTLRRRLFALHSWLGFNLAMFMTLVIFTGTVAVVSDEIDWLIHPELRTFGDASAMDWQRFEAAVRTARPQDTLTSLSMGEEAYFTHRAIMITPLGKRYFLYVDPVSYTVTGTTGTLTVQRFFRDLHRYLFMPSIFGLPLVTTMAVVLLISLYTGLKTVRNWRTVASRVRLSKGTRVAVGDYHKASGLWGIWFFVVIILTSFWYFAEFIGAVSGERFEPARPGISADRSTNLGRTSTPASAQDLVQAAQAAFPGLRARTIFFALTPRQAVTVTGRYSDPLVRDRANRVFLDPIDASIIHVQRSSQINWVAYLNELADPLHFGSFGGLLTKIIWFVFGAAMLLLSLTGVWLTWRRLKTRQPTQAQWANLPLLIVVTVFGVPYVQRHIESPDPRAAQPLGHQLQAGLDIELGYTDESRDELQVFVRTDAGRINLTSVEVTPLGASDASALSARVGLLGATVRARLSIDPAQRNASHYQVALHFSNGDAVIAEFENIAQQHATSRPRRMPL